jgi:hypothetical protein
MKILATLRTNTINRNIKRGLHTGWPELITSQGHLVQNEEAIKKAADLVKEQKYRYHASKGRPDQMFGSGNRYRMALVSAFSHFLEDPSNRMHGDDPKQSLKKEALVVKSLYATQVAYFEFVVRQITTHDLKTTQTKNA